MKNKPTSTMQVGILSGLLASILFIYFIDPILSFLGKNVLKMANKLHLLYLDRIYRELATGDLDHAYVLHTLLLSCIIGFIIGFWTMVLCRFFDKDKADESDQVSTWKVVSAFIFSLIMVFSFMLSMVDNHIRLKTATSYRQYLTIIAPYISDVEMKILRARYASMTCKKDYDKLMETIKSTAIASGVTLPENKLYPLF